ncbi:UxaA family hydrolase [Flavivirga amylovorans]|uniref:UxaA family hydrolase n=1 Tax=Flavivirga amylovorans TaxID=870486 RepID=A0ABT8WXQ3_9FLAO|nr:UxaA family hydrolase [Flavivirga amylovorans]MDO5986169.1 UxaA family hydrolase [Flavivirga amylovorans]
MKQALIKIHNDDNVATALEKLSIGLVSFRDTEKKIVQVDVIETINAGHKIALKDLKQGEPIVKYGVIIGYASIPIGLGTWIHLHNLESKFDERSSTLDTETGAPTDIEYL